MRIILLLSLFLSVNSSGLEVSFKQRSFLAPVSINQIYSDIFIPMLVSNKKCPLTSKHWYKLYPKKITRVESRKSISKQEFALPLGLNFYDESKQDKLQDDFDKFIGEESYEPEKNEKKCGVFLNYIIAEKYTAKMSVKFDSISHSLMDRVDALKDYDIEADFKNGIKKELSETVADICTELEDTRSEVIDQIEYMIRQCTKRAFGMSDDSFTKDFACKNFNKNICSMYSKKK